MSSAAYIPGTQQGSSTGSTFQQSQILQRDKDQSTLERVEDILPIIPMDIHTTLTTGPIYPPYSHPQSGWSMLSASIMRNNLLKPAHRVLVPSHI